VAEVVRVIDPTELALAVVLGGALGSGAWCLAAATPSWRAPALSVRIAPYIRDVTDPAGTTPPEILGDPTLALAGGVRGAWRRAKRAFSALLGGSDVLELRIAQAGLPIELAAFRG